MLALRFGSTPEGFLPTLGAIVGVPDILIALTLARRTQPGARLNLLIGNPPYPARAQVVS